MEFIPIHSWRAPRIPLVELNDMLHEVQPMPRALDMMIFRPLVPILKYEERLLLGDRRTRIKQGEFKGTPGFGGLLPQDLYLVGDVLSMGTVFIWSRLTILQGIGEEICKDLSGETEVDKYRQLLIRGKARRLDDLNALIR